jgi:hypothetical protein
VGSTRRVQKQKEFSERKLIPYSHIGSQRALTSLVWFPLATTIFFFFFFLEKKKKNYPLLLFLYIYGKLYNTTTKFDEHYCC